MINSRIQNTFKNLKKNRRKALITFVTGCDPDYETSKKILNELVKQGTDLLEIGMPFSDPMADGPSIQKSSLNYHIQTHRIDKLLKCPENDCEYKCIRKDQLNNHIKIKHKK